MDNQFVNEVRPLPPPEAPTWPPRESEPAPENIETAPEGPAAMPSVQDESPVVNTEPNLSAAPVVIKSDLEKEIEDVLQEDLDELFWNLQPAEQLAFKQKGEETAARVRTLLGETTLRIQEIFKAILEWLKILPGVNSFFAEKEAKIKTDKVLRLRQ